MTTNYKKKMSFPLAGRRFRVGDIQFTSTSQVHSGVVYFV